MALRHSLGMQLYSARNFPPQEAQLAAVAAAGFTNVEPFGPFYDDVEATARLLKQHGLGAASGHFAIAMAEREPDRVVAICRALGMGIVVVPYLLPAERPADRPDWEAFGRRLQAVGHRMARDGLRLAWHNHDFEFAPLPDGSLPIEHVLGQDVLWEADLAWIVKGGADPAAWLDRYHGRVPLVHVKDIAEPSANRDEDGWADVGSGTLPWAALWRRAVEAGAEAMIAEHDNPSDFERFARNSAAAMRGFEAEARR